MASAVRTPVVAAGITIETMSLDEALVIVSMDRAEFEQVMAPSPAWPHPAHLDGWKLAHNAIRYDMDAIKSGIDKTIALVESGQSLQHWQIAAFQLIVKDFYHNVHFHHDHEERIFFPWFETRVKLPPKMSADHRTLMELLDSVRDLSARLTPEDNAPLKDLASTFSRLRALMWGHLEEEEVIGLPLMRKHFTAKEAAVPEKKIGAELKPSDMAWFLRPMDVAEKKVAMTRMGIPGFVQRLVMMPAVRRDDRSVMRAYRELAAAGKEEAMSPPQGRKGSSRVKRAFCLCTA